LDCSGELLQPLVALVALEFGFDGGIHDVAYDPAAGALEGSMGMRTAETSFKPNELKTSPTNKIAERKAKGDQQTKWQKERKRGGGGKERGWAAGTARVRHPKKLTVAGTNRMMTAQVKG
jgi:hypothetical protein